MAVAQNSKPLFHKTIESMKPKDDDKADIGENRGLRVTCGATGKKSFFYRYRHPVTGNLVQMQLGIFPAMTLDQARIKLKDLKQIRHLGRCPATEAKEQLNLEKIKIEQEAAKDKFTVTDLVELYLTQYIEDRRLPNGTVIQGARKPKGQSEVRRTLYGDAVKVLGGKAAAEVSRQNIIDMVMAIVERGANVQAGNVLRELTACYDYAIGLGRFDDDFINPALQAKTSLKRTKIKLTASKGDRVLSDTELTMLLKWLPGSGYSGPIKNVIRMTLWTGCRTGEICPALWKDVDLDKGIYHIKESKTDVSREVQLPQQAVEFLKYLRLSTDSCLFPSFVTKEPIQQKLLTETAWRLRQEKRMIDIAPWTPHDLRRTVRTGLARLQCPSDVAEAVLGHAPKGIEGTYNLHRYSAECKHWLQVWADHLDKLISAS